MWGQALLAWSRSFSNFAQAAQTQRFFGWSEATVNEPCSWTGINCSPDTFAIVMRFFGLNGAHAA